MNFITYEPNKRTANLNPEIRISKSGFMTISPVFIDKHFKDCQYAQLLFDSESRSIGIKPASPQDMNTLKLSIPKGSKSKRLSVSGFLEFCSIKLNKNITCIGEWNEAVGAVIIKLP